MGSAASIIAPLALGVGAIATGGFGLLPAAGAAGAAGSLGSVAPYLALGGSALNAAGTLAQGEATQSAEKYDAQIASENAQLATQSANLAGAAGESQTQQSELQSRATVGALVANEAASGLDVNSGSDLLVKESAQQLGQLQSINIMSNAARQAFGYQTQATSDTAQSSLEKYESELALPDAEIESAGGILGSTSSSLLTYGKFLNGSSQTLFPSL